MSKQEETSVVKLHDTSILLDHVPKLIILENALGIEGPCTKSEIFFALSELPNDKTPGIDGLSKEFTKAFWPDLSDFILHIINEAWDSQILSPSLKTSITKLILKETFCTSLSQ